MSERSLRAEVAGLAWERPQLVVTVRSDKGPLAAGAFQLVRDGPRREIMPPTGSRVDGDALDLRFNVTVGPGLRPLDDGRWRLLVGRNDSSAATPVGVQGSVDPSAAERAFRVPQGVYRVTPLIDPSTGGLVVDISLEARAPRRQGLARRMLHQARRAIRPAARGQAAVFALMKLLRRRDGRRVLFVTGRKVELRDNLRIVHDRMVERGLDREYELRATFRRYPRGVGRLREALALRWALAAADVILIEGSRQRLVYTVDLAPDVRLIQMWHASGAFKAVGYSRLGRRLGPDPWSRDHRNYSHAIVSSEHDVQFYAEAFGIPEERVRPTGIPRMDRFFDERLGGLGRSAARAAFPETEGRMTILFAPTYRRGDDKSFGYPIEKIDYEALHAVCVEKEAVAIIRMHPFARRDLAIPERFRDRLLDGLQRPIDVNDLLLIVDLLITDYSSILFEFSTLGRPMLFYAYDFDAFADLRDLYVPFETFVPGRIVRTFPELVDAIRRDDYEIEKVAHFAEEHFAHLDAGSTDRVIDELVLDGLRRPAR